MKIALVGNPRSGKTTFFRALTGSKQSVGNWHELTLEKRTGRLKRHSNVKIIELPGVYSLSPYTLEEVMTREYLLDESPDVIMNIVDGTNLERSLYLTSQLLELGIPVVAAINMSDLVKKTGGQINTKELARRLGCRVIEICAVRGKGITDAAEMAVEAAVDPRRVLPQHHFSREIENALTEISQLALKTVDPRRKKWYALKLFERDDKIVRKADITERTRDLIDKETKKIEDKFGEDAESMIANERYAYITAVIRSCYKKEESGKTDLTEKIDRIVLHPVAAVPIFIAVMCLVYTVALLPWGDAVTHWVCNGVFGEGFYLFGMEDSWIPGLGSFAKSLMMEIRWPEWVQALIADGVLGSIGMVFSFVPQMMLLLIMLSALDGCGYMARVVFLFDRIFRKFGLSGSSLVPLLMSAGSNVQGTAAAGLVKDDRSRKMTVITAAFLPDHTKLPMLTLAAAVWFGGSPLAAAGAYAVCFAAVLLSGMILKKISAFTEQPSPFMMELPQYRKPKISHVLRSMKERTGAFLKRAGVLIFVVSLLVWAGSHFGAAADGFGYSAAMSLSDSIFGIVCERVAWLFAALGFGSPRATAAVLAGLVSKSQSAVLMGNAGLTELTMPAGMAFLTFYLLGFQSAAVFGTVRKEMNSVRWTWMAMGYQTLFAYAISLMVYQFGSALAGERGTEYILGLVAAFIILTFLCVMLLRPYKESETLVYSVSHKKSKK